MRVVPPTLQVARDVQTVLKSARGQSAKFR